MKSLCLVILQILIFMAVNMVTERLFRIPQLIYKVFPFLLRVIHSCARGCRGMNAIATM